MSEAGIRSAEAGRWPCCIGCVGEVTVGLVEVSAPCDIGERSGEISGGLGFDILECPNCMPGRPADGSERSDRSASQPIVNDRTGLADRSGASDLARRFRTCRSNGEEATDRRFRRGSNTTVRRLRKRRSCGCCTAGLLESIVGRYGPCRRPAFPFARFSPDRPLVGPARSSAIELSAEAQTTTRPKSRAARPIEADADRVHPAQRSICHFHDDPRRRA